MGKTVLYFLFQVSRSVPSRRSSPQRRAGSSEASQDLEVHVPEPLSGGPYFSKLMTR
ncbi:Hypothetical protein SMAX5B_016992 [Scophthalmus maximus]|uniref:Uncharacterized protein n=1 Tax=Scophthalmus maximus TaxID=52904 RepID=A0A2U9BA22_SCOMX|nr:Hypothetical protein SMAX5B_016992 [Scophthalmus maximus]